MFTVEWTRTFSRILQDYSRILRVQLRRAAWNATSSRWGIVTEEEECYCVDIDECSLPDNYGCSHISINTKGNIQFQLFETLILINSRCRVGSLRLSRWLENGRWPQNLFRYNFECYVIWFNWIKFSILITNRCWRMHDQEFRLLSPMY